jgi:hypothetical protein
MGSAAAFTSLKPNTADEVTAKGEGQWITAREDKSVAKGKGEMQTYFVHAHDAKSSVMTMTM